MQINQEKLERQLQGVSKWFIAQCIGTLWYATGVGKTFTAFLVIKELEKNHRGTYIVVVPGADLKLQWERLIEKQFPKHLIERIVVKTVQTLISEDIIYEVETQIVDEIHEFTTEERLKVIDGTLIKAKKKLGLTASADDKNFWKVKKLFPVVDTISDEEAKEKGFVADFIEYNLGLPLTLVEQETYDHYTAIISKLMPKFENDIRLAQNVISGGKHSTGIYYSGAGWAMGLAVKKGWRKDLDLRFPAHKEIDDLWNPSNFIGYANSLMRAIKGRKTLLYTASAKYNMTVELVKKFNKVKTIVFSESTTFADKVGEVLNAQKQPTVVYHSSLKTRMVPSPKTGKLIKYGSTRLKREALDSIRTAKARVLSTAKSLDRGLDITDLRFSITTSGTQNPTQYKQRKGRSTRKEESIFADVPVLLVNLYIVGTQDEIWLNKRQSKSNHKPIVVNSIDDISYIPPANVEFTINDI